MERARRVELAKRRALMEEVPRYLAAIAARGEPVLAGCVENVPPARRWDRWDAWRRQIEAIGPYSTRLIALNAMHAQPVATARAPQSRDRLFLAFWLTALGRRPDWDKWLRPRAWCGDCGAWVDAVQTFKNPQHDMGVYGIRHGQYFYRCPRLHGSWRGSRRPGIVEPAVLPAAAAIDWTLPPGARIADRVDAKGRPDPLKPATLARIEAGLRRYTGHVLLAPAGGTRRTDAYPAAVPMPTRTTRETDAVVIPPTGRSGSQGLLVPTATWDRDAYPADGPLRTQTTRQDTALVQPDAQLGPAGGPAGGVVAFLASLRGGGSRDTARGIDQPLLMFSASGTHHALIHGPDRARADQGLLVPYYGHGTARTTGGPIGTLTTRDRYALVALADRQVRAEDCTFRMLAPAEIRAGMAFAPTYRVMGSQREQVAGYGNAVCPPVAEVIVSALVEAITGHDLPSHHDQPAGPTPQEVPA